MKYITALKKPVLVTLALLVLCGFIYPLFLTGLAQVLFPWQANGSVVAADGVAVGSAIVGQDFTDARFMRCRPSAVGYNTYTEEEKADGTYGGLASGSNNYAPSNPALKERVEADIAAFLASHPGVAKENIPTDLLTASGSGLDPHISPASAEVQVPQLAKETGLSEAGLRKIVAQHTEGKFLGVFGEARVNVLGVNLDIAQALGLLGSTGKAK